MSVFKNRSFRLLCYTTAISSLGDSLYSLAVTLTVYAMSGSIAGVAGMWLIRALIRIPSQFVSGIVADRCNRKKVSVAIYLVSAVLVSLFVWMNESKLILAFVLIFILQGTSDMDNMAQSAILPELVDKEELRAANSIFHTLGIIIMLVGPGLGGILYTMFGSNILYMIDAVTFVIAAVIMALVPYQYTKTEKQEVEFTMFQFAKEGLAEVKKHDIVKVMMLTTIFFGIMGRFYEIDKVYLADNILEIGAEGIVFFSYAMSAGSLLAPVAVKYFDKKQASPVKTYAVLCICSVLGYVAWGNATQLVLCLTANFFIGIFDGSSSIYRSLVLQKNIDRACMGRVMAFYRICLVLSAIAGALLAPTFVEIMGIGGSMIGVGVFALICLVAILYMNRKKNAMEVA